jgi:aspartate aminotransferase-like enzyme
MFRIVSNVAEVQFMRKKRLMAPGPTPVPEESLLAMARPAFHHRTSTFMEMFQEVNEGLKYAFQTSNPVLTFASSGTGGMEGAVVNTLCAGDTALVVRGGKFGERWAEICQSYGVKVVPIDVEWGRAVEPDQIAKELKKNAAIKAVFTTLCETSTAVLTDIEGVGKIMRGTDALLVVDAISGLCADDLRTDVWGVDIVVGASQKGLMTPPGLAFVSLSDRARSAMSKSTLPKYYFSFQKALKSLEKTDTAFTPAVPLVVALSKSLAMLKEETLEKVLARHGRLAEAARAGVKGMGLELFSKAPGNTVTALKVPDGVDGSELYKNIMESFGVTLAGGQGMLKGKILRIAHLGYCDDFDLLNALAAIEMALKKMGYKQIEVGAGVVAAERALAESEV